MLIDPTPVPLYLIKTKSPVLVFLFHKLHGPPSATNDPKPAPLPGSPTKVIPVVVLSYTDLLIVTLPLFDTIVLPKIFKVLAAGKLLDGIALVFPANNVTELLENKIKMIIQVAKKYNHKTIVFGAMGCGAWQNPPHHVATIFHKVLKEYDGIIDNYIFAILRNYNNDDDDSENNYDIFKTVFQI